MTRSGRHRTGRRSTAECSDSTMGVALAILAVLGLAGPTWTLRQQAADLLSAERPAPISTPDTYEALI